MRRKTPWHILFRALHPAVWVRYYLTLYPANKPAVLTLYCKAPHAYWKCRAAWKSCCATSKTASDDRLPHLTASTLVYHGKRVSRFHGKKQNINWPEQPEAIWVRGLGCGEGGEG